VEGRFHQGLRGCYPTGVRKELQEKVRRRVGGSPSRFPPLSRLAALWRNALLLRGGEWKPQLMMEPTFEKLLVLLADAEVNVVLVGVVAVTLHGYVRLTEDVDIFTLMSGLRYRDLAIDADEFELSGRKIRLASKPALIGLKCRSQREKDQLDVVALKQLSENPEAFD
jgi:hypothetical protein